LSGYGAREERGGQENTRDENLSALRLGHVLGLKMLRGKGQQVDHHPGTRWNKKNLKYSPSVTGGGIAKKSVRASKKGAEAKERHEERRPAGRRRDIDSGVVRNGADQEKCIAKGKKDSVTSEVKGG